MTQLQNSVRLGLITVNSHSCSQNSTLIGVYKNGKAPKDLKKSIVAPPSSVERDIEKFKFYSVFVHTLGTLIINFKDQILKLIN